jgi:hypothetical protein
MKKEFQTAKNTKKTSHKEHQEWKSWILRDLFGFKHLRSKTLIRQIV